MLGAVAQAKVPLLGKEEGQGRDPSMAAQGWNLGRGMVPTDWDPTAMTSFTASMGCDSTHSAPPRPVWLAVM